MGSSGKHESARSWEAPGLTGHLAPGAEHGTGHRGLVFKLGHVRRQPLLRVVVEVEVLDDRPGLPVLGAEGNTEEEALRNAVDTGGRDRGAEAALDRGRRGQ